MAETERRFEVVSDEQATQPASDSSASITALMLSLKALSQRTLVALDNLFTLITVGLVFWLWKSIPDPNTNQIVWTGMYAAFVLAANVIVRRK